MLQTLDVYLHSQLLGRLTQNDGGRMGFSYTESWLNRPGATPLSHSLPLRKQRFTTKECRGFFAGILPEASNREILARNLGISSRNDFAMLEQIGGECAGAVTFMPVGQPMPAPNYGYRPISTAELAAILDELPKRPLLAGDQGIRLSLAGAQDKVALTIDGGAISLPLGGAPSTHILKPAVSRFPGVVINEALCMQLAAAAGLSVAKAEARTANGVEYLIVERYDRVQRHREGEFTLQRLHQEDFCQAHGVIPDLKYQKEGGPSLKQCFALLREVSSAPVIDLARLLDAVIYNYLIGNNDSHGKNFSLLWLNAGDQDRVVMAPLYDLVSTIHYPELSPDMAMKIGGEYSSKNLTPDHFERLAEESGLSKPMVRRRVPELAYIVTAALAQMDTSHPVAFAVAGLVRQRCESMRNRFPH